MSEDIPVSTYLHNTTDIETAITIFKTGFQFINYLENSTDPINIEDYISIKYFINTRKAYGNFTIIIQIPNNIIDYCIELVKDSDIHFYELIGDLLEIFSDEESVYLLPNQFIKGYYNISNDDVMRNPKFNLDYDLKQVNEKFKKLKNDD